jgi:SAM-dependent methyltransferase
MEWDGDRYQQRFDALAATGQGVHGEATFVAHRRPSSVLDAGCGTGRVSIELARRGIETVGIDRDGSMIATARRLAPDLTWVEGDVCRVELGRLFDLVVMAGNVPLFTPDGTRTALVAGCARHLAPGGSLVAGFQLDGRYPVTAYDDDCLRAGLVATGRWATWSGEPFGDAATYAVSVHRRRADGRGEVPEEPAGD